MDEQPREEGLIDKYGLIDSIVVDLDRVVVHGVSSMRIILESVQRLAALKHGLKEEEATRCAAADHHQPGDI